MYEYFARNASPELIVFTTGTPVTTGVVVYAPGLRRANVCHGLDLTFRQIPA
jgi:hypothetical protein